MVKRLRVGTSLYLLVSAMGAVALLLGVLGLAGMRVMEQELRGLYEDRVVPLRALKELSDAYGVGAVASAQRVRDQVMTWADGRSALAEGRRVIAERWKTFRSRSLDAREAKLAGELAPLLEKADGALAQLEGILRAEDADQLELFVTIDLFPAMQPVTAGLDALIRVQLDLAQEAYGRSSATYASTRMRGLGAILGGVAAGFLLAWVIIRRLLLQLGGEPTDLARAVDRIAEGDLTGDLGAGGGRQTGVFSALRRMVQRLDQVLTEVHGSAEFLAGVATQVSGASQAVSQGAAEQAASVEETSASLEEMNASISQNAESSRVCEQMARRGAAEAEEGGRAVSATVEAMTSIVRKISIVDEIAYQTNLLALNAAIEAARAGQAGRGFAVVASEVRKLAQRSQSAAREIGQLAEESMKVARRSGTLLGAIVPSIQKTAELVHDVTAASAEQASGVQQINRALGQVDQATQRSAAAAEELSSSAAEMATRAEELHRQMRFFRIRDARAPGAPAPDPREPVLRRLAG